jgi:peptide/nickel transport system ATP-binding protein
MTPASHAPLLTVDTLSVSIGGRRILNSLSFEVGAGEILGLVGASGSGKTMTALAIMGLLPAAATASGVLLLHGGPRRIRGRDVGMVFQEPMTALNPLMCIGDQVAETVRLHGSVSAAEARRAARAALDRVGLSGEQGALDRLPHELSGGQRQRVAIAAATVLEPPLLIADEPTTALDVVTQGQILRLLEELARAHNMGLILVTHDLAIAAQFTDRLALLHEGEIVEHGATRYLLQHMQHAAGRALVAAARLTPKRGGTQPAGPPVLEVNGIVHDYPRKRRSIWHAAPPLRTLDHVSLSVRAGETVGLVGESGAGKSTLLKVILALERPRAGEVRLRGAVQAVFQDPYGSFDPRWSVERLISEPFHLLRPLPPAGERRRRVAAVLDQVGLAAADARRLPHEFSGGQRQRIAIARALITVPSLIVFDEAVSALDALVRAQILGLLSELAIRLRLAYLFVSHDLHVVRSIADRIYVMQQGRIVEHGATETVFASPRHGHTQQLIAATPTLD